MNKRFCRIFKRYQMTLGSLFDGIAGFPLAASYCGIKTLWASEIEPHCVEITKRHFPLMEHLGSVTDINGAEIPPVDIITFGSPCQDLSVAGKQKGLSGERSGLFLEAVRIIREMRCATDGRYPRFAVWENVPGAYSSNKGQDYRRVLEALSETEIPMPQSGKWAESGLVQLRDREIAWRTFDAQYWGVPQRRKRIYLVTSFGGRSAAEILFKPESVLGYSPQGRKEGQEAPAAVGSCVKSAGFISRASTGAGSIGYQEEMSPTLRAGLIPDVMCAGFSGQNSITASPEFYPECAPCLRTGVIPNCLQGVFEMSHANEGLRKTDGDICPTLQSRMGTGGNQVPVVFDKSFCIAGNIVDRSETAGANGVGVKEDCSYTLNTVDRHAVAFAIGNGQSDNTGLHKILGALNCMHDQQAVIYAIDRAAFNQGENALYDFQISDSGVNSTLVSKGPSAVIYKLLSRWIARRLTPRECERLQGFPDDWTRFDTTSNEIKDLHRYKALGNSIAIPCAVRVFRGIEACERKEREVT